MKETKNERREHPRLEKTLPIKVAANGYDFTTSTHNISCLGAYCHIDKYVPPFTKVMVKLSLPLVINSRKKECDVECRGVLVRTEDAAPGGFNIAIFFNHITEQQKKTISRYISQFLPNDPCPSKRA